MVMAHTTGSTTSSMTSTSHTLTHEPLFQLPKEASSVSLRSRASAGMENLSRALEPVNRHVFIQPPVDICDAALESVKKVLDGVAPSLCDEQAARLRAGKRKRGNADGGEALRVRKVHTEGFEVDQVWEQARRVIDALRIEVTRELDELDIKAEDMANKEVEMGGKINGVVKTVKFDEDGFGIGSEEEGESGGEEDTEMEDEDAHGDDSESLADATGGDTGLDKLSDLEEEEGYEEEEQPANFFVEDSHGLNDGFFSIDDFNKQTEFLERQDATGDPYTGEASDEEDIDWDADPMTMSIPPAAKSGRAAAMDMRDDDDDSEEEVESEEGPTFGNTDLNEHDGDSDDGEGVDMAEGTYGPGDNTNDILYKDFFEPPPRKVAKGERQAKFLDRQARKSKPREAMDDEEEMERAMADVRRDLFDDNSEHEDPSDALSDVDPSDPKSRKSAHERRQAKLAEEIRRLEAASVAKREWTLSGEARAADRPQNSLLEEDLDFERTGKPVPVITAEVSEGIEELIKRRIIAQEFDEVIRRRPNSDTVPSKARRGLFELDDSKPQQSLAEIYEEEHVKATNPDTYVSKADDRLKKQHQEIEVLWKEVSGKLDALSSWHYKPKPAAPSLTVVADVSTITMEDAQPTTASDMAGAESMLAPQEIYKAGQEKQGIEKGEFVPKNGAPVAKQEMTREEKFRRRRREKERIKKKGGLEANERPKGKKAMQKKETVDELKKGGVKIIGRKGEIRDVDGNKVKAAPVTNGAGGFKL